METTVVLFVCCLLLAVLTERALKSQAPPRNRWASAWGMVIRTPALLVPAVIWVASLALMPLSWHSHGVSNEWRVWGMLTLWHVLQSATLAGLVGLLPPAHHGGKPSGIHFWLGIKQHFWTFLIAVAGSVVLIELIQTQLGTPGFLRSILFVGPSLVFAPLFGTAALHPGRPLRAISATLDRVRWDLTATAWLLTQQILILVLLWVVVRPQNDQGRGSFEILAGNTSVLSFNAEPFLWEIGPRGGIAAIGITALAMLTSTVYMVKYYRRVMDAPVQGGRVAS